MNASKLMQPLKTLMLLALLLCLAPALAQTDCPAIVEQVLANVGNICENAARNQACYGNISMQATPREGAADFKFEQVGDLADVSDLQSLKINPLNEATQEWGVALMKLQANLPDTLPGQNVTFLLFGDVEITNAVSADNQEARPMQAFYLKTGVGDAACAQAPQSGLLVQTPKGVGQVTFSVNGVDMSLGSTVFFQAQPDDHFRIQTLEGSAAMVYNDEAYPIIAGTELTIPINADLLPIDLPDLIGSYNLDELVALPMDLLDFDIEIANPLAEEAVNELLERLENGEPICGVDPFPSCDELPAILGGAVCILAADGATFDCESNPFAFSWGEDGFGDMGYLELLGELGILGENLGEVGENLGDLGENLGGILDGRGNDDNEGITSTEDAPEAEPTDDNGNDSPDDNGGGGGGDDSPDDNGGGGDDD